MDEHNVQNTETSGTPENETREDVKTFTQEEVNEIIEKRLNRERKKFTSMINADDPREHELEERRHALDVREMRLDALEILEKKGLPAESLELLNYTDKESCERSIEILEKVINTGSQVAVNRILRGGPPIRKAPVGEPRAGLRQAFGLSHGGQE